MDIDTIAAVATPPGEGGIGIIRLSGKKSLEIADAIFKGASEKPLSGLEERRLNYGHIVNPKDRRTVDEVMAVYMKEPKTYTKEDVVEIHCHGGAISVRRILELVLLEGARLAEKGEFTKRAFLNGRIDLSQAEAVIDLIKAKTDANFDMSLNQLEGSMTLKVRELQNELLSMLAHIEASIDFPDQDVEEITSEELKKTAKHVYEEIDKLIATSNTGRIIKEGVKTVILGKPNVGKSSLMNALLRENRAIVTDIPGTTRDIIEEYVNINGIPLRIVDTAGIRETDDLVEKIGVERAKEMLRDADLAIVVFDCSKELEQEDIEIISLVKDKPAIVLFNKTDLDSKLREEDVSNMLKDKYIITTSMLEGKGIDKLEEKLKEMFLSSEVEIGEDPIVTNTRQRDLLIKAKENVQDALDALNMEMPVDCIEVDIKGCWENLGFITGDSIGEDIIDKIFKNFCIGK